MFSKEGRGHGGYLHDGLIGGVGVARLLLLAAPAPRRRDGRGVGVVRSQGMLVVRPALPSHWPEARVLLRDGGKTVQVLVCQGAPQATAALASQPGARSLAAGTPLAWAGLADGQLLVVCQRQP